MVYIWYRVFIMMGGSVSTFLTSKHKTKPLRIHRRIVLFFSMSNWSVLFTSLFWLCALMQQTVAAGVSYQGSSVLRCSPTTTQQIDFLHDLSEDPNSDLDFW